MYTVLKSRVDTPTTLGLASSQAHRTSAAYPITRGSQGGGEEEGVIRKMLNNGEWSQKHSLLGSASRSKRCPRRSSVPSCHFVQSVGEQFPVPFGLVPRRFIKWEAATRHWRRVPLQAAASQRLRSSRLNPCCHFVHSLGEQVPVPVGLVPR